jgi:hypothetical protein
MRRLVHVWLALLAAFWLTRAAVSLVVFQRADRGWGALLELAAIPALQAVALAWLTRRHGNAVAASAAPSAILTAQPAAASEPSPAGDAPPGMPAATPSAATSPPAEPPAPLDSGPPPPYKRPRDRPWRSGS